MASPEELSSQGTQEAAETVLPRHATSASASSAESSQSQGTKYAFVYADDHADARSHAMRESWRQRKLRKMSHRPSQREQVPLLPRVQARTDPSLLVISTLPHGPSLGHEGSGKEEADRQLAQPFAESSSKRLSSSETGLEADENSFADMSIPGQTLAGLNRALSSVKADPFEAFPVILTAKHHELLHHWLSTYSTMMFEDMPRSAFNPMRDVWMPLDLSNAASFYAIMAHASAHLAFLRGQRSSRQALKFKTEAMVLVNQWMSNPEQRLSDDTFAAVLRLLTFERYWGTEEQWKIHRAGLQQMWEARRGIDALDSNWRLGLVVQLVLLMSRPSWFDSSNKLWGISDGLQQQSSTLTEEQKINLHRIRSLWLLSFVQDMRTLMGSHPRFNVEGLETYPCLREVIHSLRAPYLSVNYSEMMDEDNNSEEHDRLYCLFLIGVMIQESVTKMHRFSHATSPAGSHTTLGGSRLASLEEYLRDTYPGWRDSHNVTSYIIHFFATRADYVHQTQYVSWMTNILLGLSREARTGVAKCLLNMFCGSTNAMHVDDTAQLTEHDDEWTPDFLLSSIRGE